MKVWVLMFIILAGIIHPVAGQTETSKVSHILKGKRFLHVEIQTTSKNKIKESIYLTKTLAVGGGYYIFDRFAVKANVEGQRYEALEIVAPTRQEYNKKSLLLFSGQLRYNMVEEPGWGSLYVQTGYSTGKFTNNEHLKINRWEIISIGHTLYWGWSGKRNFGLEVGIGLEKETLNKKLVIPFTLGLNYYFSRSAG